MTVLVTDRELGERLIAERRASGGDRFDEVWEGVYVMAPLADNEHQLLSLDLAAAFKAVLGWPGQQVGQVFPGANVSDRDEGWEHNYRCPDVAVFLPDNPAKSCGTHWFGGPDLAVEVVSPQDRSRQKLEFYASVGVRELLVIDRKPWAFELYRLDGGRLKSVGDGKAGDAHSVASAVLPISYRMVAGQDRPRIEMTDQRTGQTWFA